MRTHVLRGTLNPQHHGVKSPLAAAEEALVAIIIQMGMIRQPLKVNEGIQLMNSFIKKTNLQSEVIKFQKSRNLGNGLKYGEIGKGLAERIFKETWR